MTRSGGIVAGGLRGLLRASLAVLLSAAALVGAELHGHVTFGGLPLPGATVTLTQSEKTLTAVTDGAGVYSFMDVAEGAWHAKVEMLCFTTIEQDVTVSSSGTGPDFDMKVLPLEEIEKSAPAPPPPPPISITPPVTTSSNTKGNSNTKGKKNAPTQAANGQPGFQRTDVNAGSGANAAPPAAAGDSFAGQNAADLSQRASDGLLVNGSSMNGAASPFSQSQAFGNNRRGAGSLYNGNVGFSFDNSVLDAKSYSLTGQEEPKPNYDHFTVFGTVGGPLRLPKIHWQQPPFFTVSYQFLHNRNDNTQSAFVPTADERMGVLPNGTVIPQTMISPQAQALLALYPMPNFSSGIYNYQTTLVSAQNQSSLQARFNKSVNQKNQIAGNFAFQKTAVSNPNVFNFLDHNNVFGFIAGTQWTHRFNQRFFATFGYQFSRQSTTVMPYWANRANVSGNAGITGNDQSPLYWGPPTIAFGTSGITALNDGNPTANHNQTSDVSNTTYWYRSPHTVSFGGDWKPIQANSLSQANPRGTFVFNGQATGSDIQDFLLGVPDTASIAFGNADKYFRTTSWDVFINDDWRLSPGLTLTFGVRWEYSAPITELYGRLVNLDVSNDFGAISPVVAQSPVGGLAGTHYPASLLSPDKHAFQPRGAFAWRPFPASSMIVRGGYGVYYNTSVYQSIATQMAQQPPLSKTFSLANTAATPLTLANGLNVSTAGVATNTFGIDPNFLIGYAQTWNVSVQRDLPGGMVMIASYLGIKGTREPQEFLPNSYPLGGVNPCPLCPSGFIYETSNGNSNREAGQLQLRRRLHAGLTAQLQYTYAKAIDDGALGGSPNGQAGGSAVIAQNWRNLDAERALSTFDQRHQVTGSWQYSTGEGINGGTLLSGWRGRLYKDWTFTNAITWGTGMPLTPVLEATVPGTGQTGVLRPEYTGQPVYEAASGFYVNSAAFVTPAAGVFGNTGRDTVTGPIQFSFNASMARIFRLTGRYNLEFQLNSTNTLNHVTWASYNMVVGTSQFGFPTAGNAMRDVTTTLRLRF